MQEVSMDIYNLPELEATQEVTTHAKRQRVVNAIIKASEEGNSYVEFSHLLLDPTMIKHLSESGYHIDSSGLNSNPQFYRVSWFEF